MDSVQTDRAKNYKTFLNERVRLWVLKSGISDGDLAKLSGVSRQTIFNFKNNISDLDHENLLSVGFAIKKSYDEITHISEKQKQELDSD